MKQDRVRRNTIADEDSRLPTAQDTQLLKKGLRSQKKQIIAANLGVPAVNVRPESMALDFSEWDSLRRLLLVMEIEEKFGFKFALEEIASLDSVDKIVAAVQKRIAA